MQRTRRKFASDGYTFRTRGNIGDLPGQPSALVEYAVQRRLHELDITQRRECGSAGEGIDVVRRFDLHHIRNNVLSGEAETKAHAGEPPCLGKCPHDDEIRMFFYMNRQRRCSGKIEIRFVHNHNAVQRAQFQNIFRPEKVCRRIIGGAAENNFYGSVECFLCLRNVDLKIFREQAGTDFCILNRKRRRGTCRRSVPEEERNPVPVRRRHG